MDVQDIPNIVSPNGSSASTCGYCSPPGQRSEDKTNYHSATLQAAKLTCSAYQEMIDRGWRRSGTYCYKPDLKISCCPQYTIKLDAMVFEPSRSQRQLLNRWNRFVLDGQSDTPMDVENTSKADVLTGMKTAKKAKKQSFMSLPDSVHGSESNIRLDQNASHIFKVVLEPSSYTVQKFALYKKYQEDIHHDMRSSPAGFKRFLVDSPLVAEPIPYSSTLPSHLPQNYGSYHQLYMLDGQLIAMAVLDILPKCISSVYFMYDKAWERFSMGKLSALREVALAREVREAGAPEMEALYMGFYIYSCQKMKYKGEYAPSYLADPETYKWYPLQTCIPLLEKYRYACFSEPSHSNEDAAEPDDQSESDLLELPEEAEEFDNIKIVALNPRTGKMEAVAIRATGYLSIARVRQEIGTCIWGLGSTLGKKFTFIL